MRGVLLAALWIGVGVSTAFSDLVDGLVGYWKFDSYAAGTTPDSSGSGHTGTIVGNTTYLPSSGISGGAFRMDGTSDHIDVDGQGNLVPSNNRITVSAWINMAGAVGDTVQHPMSFWNNYWLRVADDRSWAAFAVFRGSNNDGTSGVYWDPAGSDPLFGYNTWHHLAGSYDGSMLQVYFDGVPRASNTLNIAMYTSTANDLMMGAVSWSGDRQEWNGMLDEVAVWNRALSPDEIHTVYEQGTIPEPGTLVLLGVAGCLGVSLRRRRRKGGGPSSRNPRAG